MREHCDELCENHLHGTARTCWCCAEDRIPHLEARVSGLEAENIKLREALHTILGSKIDRTDDLVGRSLQDPEMLRLCAVEFARDGQVLLDEVTAENARLRAALADMSCSAAT